MNDMAKVTWSAAGQSVELPEGYRFEGDAVRISREGDRIVLAPLDPVGDASIDDEGTDSETGLPVAELRRLIDEGLEGPDEVWDSEDITRRGRERLAARETLA